MAPKQLIPNNINGIILKNEILLVDSHFFSLVSDAALKN